MPPLAAALRDPQGRTLDTLRLAVTDRCNLRCRYCMPAAGAELLPRDELLSYEELLRLAERLCLRGVRRIRVTGGEPLVRRGLPDFLARLAGLPGAPEILLTTNGVLLAENLDAVKRAGVRRVNLSLDSLDRAVYARLTRRDALPRVLPLLDAVPAAGLGLKLNVVVQAGVNEGEIPRFVDLARTRDLTVRFLEPMPFTGDPATFAPFPGARILEILHGLAPLTPTVVEAGGVADVFTAPGWAGRVGVIHGHGRTFCGRCSRLRLDARGRLRTCLYGRTAVDLGALLRAGAAAADLDRAVTAAVASRAVDGHAAERESRGGRSMAGIGG